jgi:hypothetical protein
MLFLLPLLERLSLAPPLLVQSLEPVMSLSVVLLKLQAPVAPVALSKTAV